MDSERDALFAALQQQIAAERGARAWLRARPTWLRLTLALLVAALMPTAVGLWWARPNLSLYPTARLAIELAILGTLATVAVLLALRPLHRPPLRAAVRLALVGIAAGAAIVLAALPEPSGLAGSFPTGEFAHHALGCLGMGLAMAIPVLLVIRALDRGPLVGVTALVAGGLVSDIILGLHCPIASPAHLLAGHASVVAVSALVAALLWWRRRAA